LHKALKVTLIVLGCLVGLGLLLFIALVIAGTQEVQDPFDGTGIEVIEAPFSGSQVTMTWKVYGNVEATGVYVTAQSVPDAHQSTPPKDAGYTGTPIAGVNTGDTYSATVPVSGAVAYARVWARIDGVDTWSIEYPILRGAQ